jgi:hypothetical protein
MAKKGRNADLVALRNEALLARYYYWSVIWERQHAKVLKILSREFFITEATIMRELLNHDDFLQKLIHYKVTIDKLAQVYPEWNWRPNTRFGYSKEQMKLF